MRSMMLLAAWMALPAMAGADAPWGAAVDLKHGEALHGEKCVSCHVRMYGGDGSRMYTRDGRLLSTRLEVLQRVASCNAMVSAGWFPDEEANVAAWLNRRYYQFSQ